jgi:hypothetical protein
VSKPPATSDSSIYRGSFYGILNAQGDFWTPLAFESERAAADHMARFWGANVENLNKCRATHRIVPVRVQLTELREEPE